VAGGLWDRGSCIALRIAALNVAHEFLQVEFCSAAPARDASSC
jgi:hypothetical protein